MEKLKSQILSAYGEKGRIWLEQLPALARLCSCQWHLSDLTPFENLSWNYVAHGTSPLGEVVLKISFHQLEFEREVETLRIFPNKAAAQLLEFDPSNKALLLEQLKPGLDLKSSSLSEIEKLKICAKVAKELSLEQRQSTFSFPKIQDQLKQFDKNWNDLPAHLLHFAKQLRDQLLIDYSETHIIHGDLHRENILSDGNTWKAIDPKGYLGNLYNEVWPFIHEPEREIPIVAAELQLEASKLTKWCFVHSVLSATWCLEDGVDPSRILSLANKIWPMLT